VIDKHKYSQNILLINKDDNLDMTSKEVLLYKGFQVLQNEIKNFNSMDYQLAKNLNQITDIGDLKPMKPQAEQQDIETCKNCNKICKTL
jgi:hypothetical protein